MVVQRLAKVSSSLRVPQDTNVASTEPRSTESRHLQISTMLSTEQSVEDETSARHMQTALYPLCNFTFTLMFQWLPQTCSISSRVQGLPRPCALSPSENHTMQNTWSSKRCYTPSTAVKSRRISRSQFRSTGNHLPTQKARSKIDIAINESGNRTPHTARRPGNRNGEHSV